MKKPSIIRSPERKRRTGLSDAQTWRLEQRGLHPVRVQLSERAVGWVEEEIDAWVHARIRAGGRCPAPPLPKRRREKTRAEDQAAV